MFDDGATESEAVEATTAAMRAGADVVYQGALGDDDWRGFADFLERVPVPCPAFGHYSYEVVDTKLAKHSKPSYLVQLCLYSDLLARVQGKQPERMHVVLGSGERETFRLDEFFAFYRRLRRRYGARLAEAFDGTYPDPVAHCGLCRWSEHCAARWEADDHLSLVAGLGRAQTVRLGEVGITTCAQLAVAVPGDRPARIGRPTFERLCHQARLQSYRALDGAAALRVTPARGGTRLCATARAAAG